MKRLFARPRCGALLSLALLAPLGAAAAPSTVNCTVPNVIAVVSNLQNSHTNEPSKDYIDVPETKTEFEHAGGPSCVLVRFSAVTFVGTKNTLEVRAMIDNGNFALPQDVQYSGNDNGGFRAHSYDFVFPVISTGKHTVAMQFRSKNGDRVYIHRHTMVIHYRAPE